MLHRKAYVILKYHDPNIIVHFIIIFFNCFNRMILRVNSTHIFTDLFLVYLNTWTSFYITLDLVCVIVFVFNSW